MQGLRSYLASWWLYDEGTTIDDAAYERFMLWMAQPTTWKPYKWKTYSRWEFFVDMAELKRLRFLFKIRDFEPMMEDEAGRLTQ